MTRASTLAYDTVRQWILDGECRPGQRLIEEDVAQRIGVSRTSVRDCFRRLAADGLVRTESSRGTFVLELGSAEVDEIFQLRAMLEGHAASLAAVHGRPADWDEMSRIARDIDDLLDAENTEDGGLLSRFQALNTEFHQALLRASRSSRLQALAKGLLDLPLVTLKQHGWPGEVRVRRSNQQHWELIDALKARDPFLCRLRHQAHILSARPRAMVAQTVPATALM